MVHSQGSILFRLLSAALAVALICVGGIAAQPKAAAEQVQLDDPQRNAIAMLNYITVLTQEINASKNSRLAMEEAYSSLINNTYPNSVDNRTLSQLTGLLDTMEAYRMVDVKRDRLEFIYEQNQAMALRAAVPDAGDILNLVESVRNKSLAVIAGDPKAKAEALFSMAVSITHMAADSATSYMAAATEADLEYIKDGWSLDDAEAATLHESRKGIFSYMIEMVGEYDLPGDLTLTESSVEEFVSWKNDDNVVGRIHFLESNQATYQSYGGYWLLLCESYFQNGDYAKSLEALNTYEGMNARIFRKDYELARVLPLAITAADATMVDSDYVNAASRYAQMILDNTDNDDWALRYFAARTYTVLYAKTGDAAWLDRAYDVTLDNVNDLVVEQRALNAAYLAPVQEAVAAKGATKAEKDDIKNYNRSLKEARKTELPPVYEPLMLNCELLLRLAGQRGIDEAEQQKLDGILHPSGAPLFLTESVDDVFWFVGAPAHTADGEIEVEYGGTALILPAYCVTRDADITVTVREADADEPVVLTDWKLDEVQRQNEASVYDHYAVYTSEEAKKHTWKPDAEIEVRVVPRVGFAGEAGYTFDFVAHGTKNNWYDYLKVWEGHKNNWYDYGKVWENSVVFERVN